MPQQVERVMLAERPPHAVTVTEHLPGPQAERVGEVDRPRGDAPPRPGSATPLGERGPDCRGGIIAEKTRRLDPHVWPQIGFDERQSPVAATQRGNVGKPVQAESRTEGGKRVAQMPIEVGQRRVPAHL